MSGEGSVLLELFAGMLTGRGRWPRAADNAPGRCMPGMWDQIHTGL